MFEVGFTEIILILGLALLVLGPEKLPALAQKVGRWTGRARAMARQLRTQLEHEVTMEELAKSRPMQSAAPEPSATSPTPSSTASDVPPQAEPAPELDATASGVEPAAGTPEQDAAEGAAAKAQQ
jgi:sec-independent protein translocase protein TatB